MTVTTWELTSDDIVAGEPDLLGETPVYDAARQRVLWVDMFGHRVRELVYSGPSSWTPGRTWDLGRLVSVVVPRVTGGILVAAHHEFVAIDDDGTVATFATLTDDLAGLRLNDGRCDQLGRLVTGLSTESGVGAGRVVSLGGDRRLETVLTDIGLPNGLDWSPDGRTLYLVDSLARTVDAFDYDVGTGRLGGRRTVLTIEAGAGGPNGLTTDHDGALWVAITYGHEVRRYAPDGTLLATVTTSTPRPTACAFAGPRGDELIVTSSAFDTPRPILETIGVTADRIAAGERDQVGGALFVCRPGVTGPPATPFAG